jgi:hypothetical protein
MLLAKNDKMNTKKKALLLIGSPKKYQSASEFTGGFLLALLDEKGMRTEKLQMLPLIQSEEGKNILLSAIDSTDIIIFSCPLYIDSMPHWVISTMELIVEYRKKLNNPKKQTFVAISNCGYPEAKHNNVALAIYRKFAKEADFKWAGGLAFGMAAATCVKISKKAGFLFQNVKKTLNITADALIEDRYIPKEAYELMVKPFAPAWFYIYSATTVGLFTIIKNRAWNINSRPYCKKVI